MAQSRFSRDFEAVIDGLRIVPPIRITFDADKTVGTEGRNHATVRLYNLKEANRLKLAKDVEEIEKIIPAQLSVGYENQLRLLFSGTVHRGVNFREGPDHVTELEIIDGGVDHLNAFTSRTVKGKERAVDAILSDMPNTEVGKLTDQSPLVRPKVLVGASTKLLTDVINDGETWYIDDGKLYIIKDDEVVSSFVPVVNAKTGLLNTPTREQSKITFETLMNPALKIGGLCKLVSASAPHLDGIYKIQTIGYTGDSYGSDWLQSVTGYLAGDYRVL